MGRDVKYIQLPPLPEDIEMPALEVIWLIARMNSDFRMVFRRMYLFF